MLLISIFLIPGRPSLVGALFARYGRRASAATTITFALTAPAFLFCSCSAEPPEDGPLYDIIVNSPGDAASIDLFFFDDTPLQRLDSYVRLDAPEGNRITANSSNRAARLVMFSNVSGSPYEWSGIDSYASLSHRSFILDNELSSAPMLSGETVLEAGWSRACVLSLQTSLTRVRLHQIEFDFSGRPYSGAKADDIKVYLTRACTECLPLQDDKGISWINAGGADSVTLSHLAHPEYLFREIEGSVGSAPRVLDLDFYTYPNRNTGFGETRLVIECSFNGKRCYYPLPLPPLVRNTVYEADVHITRMGSSDPDIPTEAGAVEYTFRVLPWEDAPSQTITF